MPDQGTLTTADRLELAHLELADPEGSPVLYHHGTPGSRLEHHPDEQVTSTAGSAGSPTTGGLRKIDTGSGRRVASAVGYAEALEDHLGLERFRAHGRLGAAIGRRRSIWLRAGARLHR